MFLLLGLAGIQAARDASVAANSGLDAAFLLMASTSMAMALIFSIWIFFRVTGAAFNPNIVSLITTAYCYLTDQICIFLLLGSP